HAALLFDVLLSEPCLERRAEASAPRPLPVDGGCRELEDGIVGRCYGIHVSAVEDDELPVRIAFRKFSRALEGYMLKEVSRAAEVLAHIVERTDRHADTPDHEWHIERVVIHHRSVGEAVFFELLSISHRYPFVSVRERFF